MQDQITEKPKEKTDEELKQLALDILEGRVFTDRHCSEPYEISMVFMPLVFLDEAGIEQLKADDPGMVYEYLTEAGPRSCNGLPNFFSMKLLSQDGTKKVMAIYDQLKEARSKAVAEAKA